jgi:drug/metabolite transporter superfamily protein YnfA
MLPLRTMDKNKTQRSEFEHAAEQEEKTGFIAELWAFLKENKKWWLIPIIVVLALFGVLVLLSGTGAAPFIYTLF